VENNLSIANMDWEDFAGEVGGDGVYRGCELPPGAPPRSRPRLSGRHDCRSSG
jgi:hypothetical protein